MFPLVSISRTRDTPVRLHRNSGTNHSRDINSASWLRRRELTDFLVVQGSVVDSYVSHLSSEILGLTKTNPQRLVCCYVIFGRIERRGFCNKLAIKKQV